jgi:hypothetical protein
MRDLQGIEGMDYSAIIAALNKAKKTAREILSWQAEEPRFLEEPRGIGSERRYTVKWWLMKHHRSLKGLDSDQSHREFVRTGATA